MVRGSACASVVVDGGSNGKVVFCTDVRVAGEHDQADGLVSGGCSVTILGIGPMLATKLKVGVASCVGEEVSGKEVEMTVDDE